MKRNNNSVYPYPSLLQSDDFLVKELGLDQECICKLQETSFLDNSNSFEWELDIKSNKWSEDDIFQKLINEKKIQYVAEFDCGGAFYNQIEESSNLPFIIKVPKDCVRDTADLTFTLVVKEEIKNFGHKYLNELFGINISYKPGDIIGFFAHKKYEFEISETELNEIGSIIRIERVDEIDFIQFDFSGDKIIIKLPSRFYTGSFLGPSRDYSFGTLEQSNNVDWLRSIIQYPFIISAIYGGLEYIHNQLSEDEDSQENTKWQRILKELADASDKFIGEFPGNTPEERLSNAFILKENLTEDFLHNVNQTYMKINSSDEDANL